MQRWMGFAIRILSLAATVAFVWLAFSRAFTLPVDPMEQRLLEQAGRLAAGQPYVDPGQVDAVMPGFPALVSFLIKSFGNEPSVPRVPAVLAILCAAFLAMAMVRSETNNATLAMAVLGVFLGSQLLEPASLGRATAESLMLALALAGCASLRLGRGMAGAFLGAALLCGAVFVHPLGLCWIAAALAHVLNDDRRRAVVFTLALAAFGTLAVMGLTHALGKDARDVAAAAALPEFAFHPGRALRLIGDDLLGRYGMLTLVVVLSVALPVRPWKGAGGIWTWMVLAAAAGAVLATQSSAADSVALLPPVLALSIAGLVAIHRVARHLSSWPGSTELAGQAVVLTALVLQFAALLSRLPAALTELRAG